MTLIELEFDLFKRNKVLVLEKLKANLSPQEKKFYTQAASYFLMDAVEQQAQGVEENTLYHHYLKQWPLHGELTVYTSEALLELHHYLLEAKNDIHRLINELRWYSARRLLPISETQRLTKSEQDSLRSKLVCEQEALQQLHDAVFHSMMARLQLTVCHSDVGFDDLIVAMYHAASDAKRITLKKDTLPPQVRHGLNADVFHQFLQAIYHHKREFMSKMNHLFNDSDRLIPLITDERTGLPKPLALKTLPIDDLPPNLAFECLNINQRYQYAMEQTQVSTFFDDKGHFQLKIHTGLSALQAIDEALNTLSQQVLKEKVTGIKLLLFWRKNRAIKKFHHDINRIQHERLFHAYCQLGWKLNESLIGAKTTLISFTHQQLNEVETFIAMLEAKKIESADFAALKEQLRKNAQALYGLYQYRKSEQCYQQGIQDLQNGHFESAHLYMRDASAYAPHTRANDYEKLLTQHLAFENGASDMVRLPAHYKAAWLNRVDVLIEKKAIKPAFRCLKQLQTLEPENVAYLKTSLALLKEFESHRIDKQYALLRQLTVLEPHCLQHWQERLWLEKSLNYVTSSLETLNALQALQPQEMLYHDERVQCLAQLCQTRQAHSLTDLKAYVHELSQYAERKKYKTHMPLVKETEQYIKNQMPEHKHSKTLFFTAPKKAVEEINPSIHLQPQSL